MKLHKGSKHRHCNIPEDPADLAYLAAIIDGEGSIQVRGNCIVLQVSNLSFELVCWLAEIAGAVQLQVNGRRRPLWRWYLCNTPITKQVLRAVLPYMIVKRVQTERILSTTLVNPS